MNFAISQSPPFWFCLFMLFSDQSTHPCGANIRGTEADYADSWREPREFVKQKTEGSGPEERNYTS
jgi:hypothetical protein